MRSRYGLKFTKISSVFALKLEILTGPPFRDFLTLPGFIFRVFRIHARNFQVLQLSARNFQLCKLQTFPTFQFEAFQFAILTP